MKNGRNGNKKINGNKLTKHHIIPRSRDGKNGNNVTRVPCSFHEHWHGVFGNMTPKEAIKFIEIVFLGKGQEIIKKKWTMKELYGLQIMLQVETIEKEKRRK